jgi:pimeloyl-ACP methyl ester carboxylesterase
MKELFLLSGLGADKRVFDFLELRNYNVHHVNWITPVPKESLAQYAMRLLPQITRNNSILIGVSFGGMIALEIAKLIPVEKVILISSAKSTAAIPSFYKFISKLRLDKLIRPASFKKPNEIFFWLFGVTSKKHKALLTSIMNDTDDTFLNWALHAIPSWKNNNSSSNHVIQIHGTNDRILNYKSADYPVIGGGHLMVVTNAREVSEILTKVLAN